MVNGYTASEVGDKIIAKLVEPYKEVVKVLDWDIQAGFSNEFSIGKLTFTAGSPIATGLGTNLDLNQGDIILAGGYEFEVDSTPNANTVELVNPSLVDLQDVSFHIKVDNWNYFSYEYRWSQNDVIEKGGELSEWHPLNYTTVIGDLLSLNLDPTKPLWLEVKSTVEDLQPLHTISFLSVTFTLEYLNGEVESCPQICTNCDPYDVIGCANILVDCDSENLYDPYGLQKPAHIYKSLSKLANNVWGHVVQYYRVEPNVRSEDVVLREYSLYDVIDRADLKIMVPNNEFPTEQANFDIWGMGFEDFEVHLLGEEFRSHFGEGKSPRARDYLYFPFNNRMYEVNSVSLADEFNRELTYFRLMLKKYENRTSTNKGQFEGEVEDLVVGVEELFGEETQDEFDKVTKPLQYHSTHHASEDGIRQFVHKTLEIKDHNLMNRWTVVSRNYYDLETIMNDPHQAPAVIYEQKSNLVEGENLAACFWFRTSPKFDRNNDVYYDTIDGTNVEGNGFIIKISRRDLMVRINNQDYIFNHDILFSSDKWYTVMVNMSNTYGEVSCRISSLDPQINFNDPTGPMELEEEFYHKLDLLSIQLWTTDVNWTLRGGALHITNIRVFNKTVEEEQQTNVLHQYVVRDAQHLVVADNAIPSLQLQKFNQVR